MSSPVIAVDVPQKRPRGRPRKVPVPASEPMPPTVDSVPEEMPVIQPVEKPALDEGNFVAKSVPKAKVSSKKYGNITEVFNGLYPQTRSGLTKDDLVKTLKGRIVSKKQYENLKTSIDRLKNLKSQREV